MKMKSGSDGFVVGIVKMHSCGCHDKDAVKCFCKHRELTKKEYNEFFSPDRCECFCHEDEEAEEVFEFDTEEVDDEY